MASINTDELVTSYLVEIVRHCGEAGMKPVETAAVVETAMTRIRPTVEACAAFVKDGDRNALMATINEIPWPERPKMPVRSG